MSEPQFYPPRHGYPPPVPPPGYPPQQGSPRDHPPQPGPPPPRFPPQQEYPPQQGPPPGFPPRRFEPQQAAVIPLVGTRGARLTARLGSVITVNGQGFGASSEKNAGWHVEWRKLRRVTLTRAYHQSRGLMAPKVWRIRLVMDAIDPSFLQRHPDFAPREGKNGGTGPGSFGVALGPVQNVVDPLS